MDYVEYIKHFYRNTVKNSPETPLFARVLTIISVGDESCSCDDSRDDVRQQLSQLQQQSSRRYLKSQLVITKLFIRL